MKDYQKDIDAINNPRSKFDDICKALGELQELVDKEKPMKPIFKRDEMGCPELCCPACGARLIFETDFQYERCHKCCQSLKWKE